MENIENRVDIKFATDKKRAQKYSSKPNFNRAVIFDENLIALHMNKTQVNYNKPIYLGAAILDISKFLM